MKNNDIKYCDFKSWVSDNKDRIYRYLVYKRMFTPYEQEHKFVDEDEFAESTYSFGKILEVIEIPNDYLIGFKEYYLEDNLYEGVAINYYKLSEIRLTYYYDDERAGEKEEDD